MARTTAVANVAANVIIPVGALCIRTDLISLPSQRRRPAVGERCLDRVPGPHFGSHLAARTLDHLHGNRLARLQLRKPRAPQHFDVNEHILGILEDVGEAEPLLAVEPLHPSGDQGQVRGVRKLGRRARSHGQLFLGRFDRDHLDRLHAPVGGLCAQHDASAFGDRAPAKVPQNIGMQKDIRAALIGQHEAEPLRGVEPLDLARNLGAVGTVFCATQDELSYRINHG
mmetsp:Transcript_780/g.1402  ORF Transcript_780/g.1402 Transcript_780/m.1402 type:complete len:227 (-) Transcript_780:229-909(-)